MITLHCSAIALFCFAQAGGPGGWTPLPEPPEAIGMGGGMVAAPDGSLFLLQASDFPGFFRYADGAWSTMAQAPSWIYGGSMLVSDGGDFLYAVADDYDIIGGGTKVLRYSIEGRNAAGQAADTWRKMTSLTGVMMYAGAAFAQGHLYVAGGWEGSAFDVRRVYRYSIADDRWERRPDAPEGTAMGPMSALHYPGNGDLLYFVPGGSRTVLTCSIATGEWNPRDAGGGTTQPPDCPQAIGSSETLPSGVSVTSLAGRYLFFIGGGTSLWQYSIEDRTWMSLPPIPDPVGAGASVVFPTVSRNLVVVRGNASKQAWSIIPPNAPPEPPAALAQKDVAGAALAHGATVQANAVLVEAKAMPPEGGLIGLEVEVTSPSVHVAARSALGAGGQVPIQVRVDGLMWGSGCQWRVRSFDVRGLASDWVAFVDATAIDFRVRTSQPPSAALLAQRRISTAGIVARGEVLKDETGVQLEARVSDDDDDVRFEVEIVEAGAAFRDLAVASSGWVPGGSTVSVVVPLSPGKYQWQGRAIARYGGASAWSGAQGDGADFELKLTGGSQGNVGSVCSAAAAVTIIPSGFFCAVAAVLLLPGRISNR